MSKYQRYLSQFLIVFSGIFVVFLFFIESSIGFKFIINLTSSFFLDFKAEEIRGNWRDFTLKNIHYDSSKVSIQAKSIHLILDMASLFKFSTVFKKFEMHDLKILSKKESISKNFTNQEISDNNIKKGFFIKYPIVFQNIHVDKISLKTSKIHVFLSNFSSGMKVINNNITFFPTFIDKTNIISTTSQLKKNFFKKNIFNINNFRKSQEINSFLYLLSKKSKFFIPFNMNLTYFKFKKINLINNNKSIFFSAVFKSQIKNNILKIKKMQIDSNIVNIKSFGKIIFSHNSVIFNIKNKIFAPTFHDKTIHVVFKANLNNKFTFQLMSHDFYKIDIGGSILLDHANHSFHIYCKSKNVFFSIKKKIILEIKKFHAILKGQLNNYYLSFKQTLKVHGVPSIFMKIHAKGNLKNISLKKINFFFLEKNISHKKKFQSEKDLIYNPDILKLIGKINVIGKSRNNVYRLCIPKIHIDSTIMKKRLSMSGAVCYKNFNILETSGINISAGKNKLKFKGFIGNRINFHTLINASNLDYFLPHLKGVIKARSHLYGNNTLPKMTNIILARNLNWKNKICLKNIKILSKINTKNQFSGQFLFDIKKLRLYSFYIHALHIEANWHNNQQKFSFLFKSPKLYTHIVSNITFNDKKNNGYGIFKKIHVKTILGELIFKKIPFFCYNYSNNKIKNFYIEKIKTKKYFLSFLKNTKKYFSNKSDTELINFQSKLFIQAKLQWIFRQFIPYGKVLLTSDHIKLNRKNKDTILFEDIDHLKISLNLIEHDVKVKFIIKKFITEFKNHNIFGTLNILDLYNKKNIEGRFIVTNFPVSFLNFFTTNFQKVQGTFSGNINFSGSLYHPKIISNISLKDIFIKSDNILKYITLFFPYLIGVVDNIKINQEIIMKNGNVLFIFNGLLSDANNIEWNIFFNSKKIALVTFHKIKLECSSQLKLHYFFQKYDLIGYIKFYFFSLKIDEKNFTI